MNKIAPGFLKLPVTVSQPRSRSGGDLAEMPFAEQLEIKNLVSNESLPESRRTLSPTPRSGDLSPIPTLAVEADTSGPFTAQPGVIGNQSQLPTLNSPSVALQPAIGDLGVTSLLPHHVPPALASAVAWPAEQLNGAPATVGFKPGRVASSRLLQPVDPVAGKGDPLPTMPIVAPSRVIPPPGSEAGPGLPELPESQTIVKGLTYLTPRLPIESVTPAKLIARHSGTTEYLPTIDSIASHGGSLDPSMGVPEVARPYGGASLKLDTEDLIEGEPVSRGTSTLPPGLSLADGTVADAGTEPPISSGGWVAVDPVANIGDQLLGVLADLSDKGSLPNLCKFHPAIAMPFEDASAATDMLEPSAGILSGEVTWARVFSEHLISNGYLSVIDEAARDGGPSSEEFEAGKPDETCATPPPREQDFAASDTDGNPAASTTVLAGMFSRSATCSDATRAAHVEQDVESEAHMVGPSMMTNESWAQRLIRLTRGEKGLHTIWLRDFSLKQREIGPLAERLRREIQVENFPIARIVVNGRVVWQAPQFGRGALICQ